MFESTGNYYLLGTGSCKSVSVDIDQSHDESHYELEVSTSDAYFRIRMQSLDPAIAILRFIEDYIGKEEFHELEIPLSETTRLLLVKDSEFMDRFFLKMFADSLFVKYTFAGLNGASFMKALQQALAESRSES
ncbi:MAG: hypothetical protein COA78_10680 [Blastopirellula sp.]|nr:MAG: hypothetical protein COA78_10680 [Blastopirellula sp.]